MAQLSLPTISNGDPESWFSQIEVFLCNSQVTSDKFVEIALPFLVGDAKIWADSMKTEISEMDWCDFTYNLIWEFDRSRYVAKESESDEESSVSVEEPVGENLATHSSNYSVCSLYREAIESVQLNSPNFSVISKSIQPIYTISDTDTVDVNDQHSIKASGNNRSIAPSVPVKVARVRDSVSQVSFHIIIPKLDRFVSKIDVPIAWQLYVSNGISKGLNQICCCSELNVWYAGSCDVQQCVVGIEIQYEACIANPDLELAVIDNSSHQPNALGAAAFSLTATMSQSAVSNCLSSGKANRVPNILHVPKEFFLGYGIVHSNVKWFTKQRVRTSLSFEVAVHFSNCLKLQYIVCAGVPCNPMHIASIVQVDRSCPLVKTINPKLVGAYRYEQHSGGQVIAPKKLKELVRGGSVS